MTVLAIASILVLSTSATAQKGTGEPTGDARELAKPAVQKMSGTVTDVKTGECEQTTGRSITEAHLIVKTDRDKSINLHLGPLDAIDDVVKQTAARASLSFEAFRTDAMPKDAYVVKSITANDKANQLRDENLRPSWAAACGSSAGMGSGRGQGGGRGYGGGRDPCW